MSSPLGACADEPPSAATVPPGLREFYAKTARADGSFQPGIDPEYRGMSDSAFSDLAAVTYACTIHKTFGWKLPHEEKTIEFLLSRQKAERRVLQRRGHGRSGVAAGADVQHDAGPRRAAVRSGVKPKHDPLPVFEEILKQDYKTLPAYSTSFFPLAYLCAGKPIPEQADRSIRALMVQDDDGYLNNHIAATFHASHYYCAGRRADAEGRADGRPHAARPEAGRQLAAEPAVARPARDVRRRLHAAARRRTAAPIARQAIDRAARWALSCRNADGGFGHFPGSTSDADAVYFQVGTLVMAGFLQARRPAAGRSAFALLGPPDAAAEKSRRRAGADRRARLGRRRCPQSRWIRSWPLERLTAIVTLWDADSGKRIGEYSKGIPTALSAVVVFARRQLVRHRQL